jgi:NAD(P)H-dependent FMN reductase
MTRILLISGSLRTGSLHTAALRAVDRIAPDGVTTAFYSDLRILPPYVPGEESAPPGVALLRHTVGTADALLFSTPEYAGSLPGGLKTMLEWLVDAGDLAGKPAAWLSISPAGHDESALATLQSVLSHGRARVLRSACIRIPLGPESAGADGIVADGQLDLALTDMVAALVRAAAAPSQRSEPSWQTYSSVFPVVMRRNA